MPRNRRFYQFTQLDDAVSGRFPRGLMRAARSPRRMSGRGYAELSVASLQTLRSGCCKADPVTSNPAQAREGLRAAPDRRWAPDFARRRLCAES